MAFGEMVLLRGMAMKYYRESEISIRQMQCFLAVAEERSFSRAAQIASARSRAPRSALTGPSSRRKRRISPAIFGTA